MTSHPKDLSDDLIRVMAEEPKICNHLHLPLQSGSTDILTKMNRRYTKEGYLDLVRKIKEACPDISLTTDIIVGFPGETEEEFQSSLDFVKKVNFADAHVFSYSNRKGTKADVMENQVDKSIKENRSRKMSGCVKTLQKNYKEVYQKIIDF